MTQRFDMPARWPFKLPATMAPYRCRTPNARVSVNRIKRLLKERDAVLVAHYYVDEICSASPKKPADAWRIRSRWRVSATPTRRARWSWPACGSWARPPKSSIRKRVLMQR